MALHFPQPSGSTRNDPGLGTPPILMASQTPIRPEESRVHHPQCEVSELRRVDGAHQRAVMGVTSRELLGGAATGVQDRRHGGAARPGDAHDLLEGDLDDLLGPGRRRVPPTRLRELGVGGDTADESGQHERRGSDPHHGLTGGDARKTPQNPERSPRGAGVPYGFRGVASSGVRVGKGHGIAGITRPATDRATTSASDSTSAVAPTS